MAHDRSPRRRAVILVSVLLLIVVSSAVVGTLLLSAEVSRADTTASIARSQSRALAWSGVQAMMAEIASSRDDLIAGGAPNVVGEHVVFTDATGARHVFRPVEDRAESEQTRLDINHATAEMLAKLPRLDETIAQAIVTKRSAASFNAIDELLNVEGVTEGLLYGDPSNDDDAPLNPFAAFDAAPDARPLADLITVYSFDPIVQTAVDEPESRGRQRLRLTDGWNDDLEQGVAERLGDDAARAFGAMFREESELTNASDLVRAMIDRSIPTEQWGAALDLFTFASGDYEYGRVDINRAPEPVIACLPGMTEQLASDLVADREGLDTDQRRRLTWPLERGVVDQEAFQQMAGWITTRSLQWRLTIEAGATRRETASGEDFGLGELYDTELELDDQPTDEFGVALDDDEDAEILRDRVALEVVIDAAARRPRVAYLADVTASEAAKTLKARREAVADRFDTRAASRLAGDEPTDPSADPFNDEGLNDEEPASAFDADSAFDNDSAFAGDNDPFAGDDPFSDDPAFADDAAFDDTSAFSDDDPSAAPATTPTTSSTDGRVGRWKNPGTGGAS